MPVPAPHCALCHRPGGRVLDREQGVLFRDRQRLDVIERSVVALGNDRIHRRGGAPDVGIAGDGVAHQSRGADADGQGVGQKDRRLECAEFVDLDEADALAEAVDHMARGPDLLAEEIAAVGQDGGDTGVDIAGLKRAVANPHVGHVADVVIAAGRQGSAGDAEIAACRHGWFPQGEECFGDRLWLFDPDWIHASDLTLLGVQIKCDAV